MFYSFLQNSIYDLCIVKFWVFLDFNYTATKKWLKKQWIEGVRLVGIWETGDEFNCFSGFRKMENELQISSVHEMCLKPVFNPED